MGQRRTSLHLIRQAIALATLTLLSACVSGVDYGPIPYSDYVADPRCDPAPGTDTTAATRDSALPYFLATSRLPDCRTPAIKLTNKRAQTIRYAMAGAPIPLPDNKHPREAPVPIAFEAPADWWAKLGTAAARNDGRVLLYVHGYNETIATSMRDTAQIARLTEFPGPMVHYSWPSHGAFLSYAVDESNNNWDQRNFRDFLFQLANRPWAREIVLVSHSMGARLIVPAIAYLDQMAPGRQAGSIDNIIMISADVDRETFERDIAEQVLTAAKVNAGRRITLYVSLADNALAASRTLHGYPRLGSPYCFDPFEAARLKAAGEPVRCYPLEARYDTPTIQRAMTVIDTTDVSHSKAGHSDYLHSAPACRDFRAVLNNDRNGVARQPTRLSYVFRLAPDPEADAASVCKEP